jgi:hypothetical protein
MTGYTTELRAVRHGDGTLLGYDVHVLIDGTSRTKVEARFAREGMFGGTDAARVSWAAIGSVDSGFAAAFGEAVTQASALIA